MSTSDAFTLRRHTRSVSPHPTLCANCDRRVFEMLYGCAVHTEKAPDSMMAPEKRPLDFGFTRCALTDAAPADCPKMVTRDASMPNTAALS